MILPKTLCFVKRYFMANTDKTPVFAAKSLVNSDNCRGNVYSRLGMCPADSSQWSAENFKELYSADYLIWANDPALLPGEPGSVMDSSSNYLGADVLNAANVPKPGYWRLVESLEAESMIYTASYYLDSTGAASLELPEQAQTAREKYDTFAFVLHDAFNKRYLTEGLS